MIQRVEKFPAELELSSFGQAEIAGQGEIPGLQTRPVNRIAPHITECESRRSGKCSPVEPRRRRVRAMAEDGLAGGVRADGVFTQHCAGVGSIAEYRNREREAGLHLIDS